ncbi:MAG TPA: DNA-processing protein DprA [Marmoricola sp.]|nr:DNA-processing protein DprA [Marmoricola sp.]
MTVVRRLDPERAARVVLSRVGEPGDPRLTGLVAELGAATVLASLREQGASGQLRDDLAARLEHTDPAGELERAERLGIRFVTPADDEWPAGLDDLAHGPPLHERGGVPVGLWLKGPALLGSLAARSIAVVGSRSATTYGADVAGDIGAALGEAGHTVVSGAAFGIDQAAHRGALAVDGPTVAVLACGVDRAYPAAHRRLLDYIAEVGVVVSEAAPGCAPTRIRFLARNRLIAAMSQGTVVVEAAIRSGALNTANWAAGLSRTLMGVPGPVTSEPSAGVHQLIRTRGALLVTDGREVLEAVAPAGEHLLAPAHEPARARDLLTTEQRQVLDAVPVQRGAVPAKIAHTAGLAPHRVEEALGDLSTAGLVECASGRWRLSAGAGGAVAPPL